MLLAALLLAACGQAPEAPERHENRGPAPAPAAPPRAPTPAPDGPPRATGIVPGAYYIDRYGLTAEEARMRQENEPLVSRLAERLRRNPPGGFSSIWIEHEPSYAIVIASTRPLDEKKVLASAAPELRPHIVFRRAKRDQATIERDLDRIIAAMRRSPGRWSGGYDVATGKFTLNVEGPGAMDYARENLPSDLRDEIVLRPGGVPVPLAR